MPAFICPDCDAMLTRLAIVTRQLRIVVAKAHKTLGHKGPSFERCAEEPCISTFITLKDNHVVKYGDYISEREAS